MNNFEPDPAFRTELEKQLLRLQPRPIAEADSSADLLYRCGWEAALAAEANAQAELRQPRFKWKEFGVGHLTGLAAGVAAALCGMSLFTSPAPNRTGAATAIAQSQVPPEPSSASQDTNSIAQVAQPDALDSSTSSLEHTMTVANPAIANAAKHFLTEQFGFLAPRRTDMIAEPIHVHQSSFDTDQQALSPLAQRNWRAVLTQTGWRSRDEQPTFEQDPNGSPSTLRAHPYNIESLKELL